MHLETRGWLKRERQQIILTTSEPASKEEEHMNDYMISYYKSRSKQARREQTGGQDA